MQAFLDIFDIYLLEAAINGILFGGVLALLALGLNLIFGVIDVTWICYAELIMIGMYGMYYLVSIYGVPYWVAAPMCILLVAGLGALLHFLVIAPLLSSPPINQLLATGGVLFFLQSFATVAFGIEFHNIGIQLPVLRFGEMNFSYARLLSFAAALIGMVSVYIFMKRTYTGTAIRAIAQDRQIMALMGVDTRKIYLITSAWAARWPALLPACWSCCTMCTRSSACRSGRSPSWSVCWAGSETSSAASWRRSCSRRSSRWAACSPTSNGGYVLAFGFFIVMMFIRPAGLLARRS